MSVPIPYNLAVLTRNVNKLSNNIMGKPLKSWDGYRLKFLGDGRPDPKYAYFL